MAELSFFYSPGSRYSYLALTQLPEIERELGVAFDWVPTVGGRIRALRGADPFEGPPLSGQYDWGYRQRDAEAWADYYGVPFREPQSVEFDARLLGLAALVAKRMGSVRDYSCELAAEVFARGRWPLDADLCSEVAAASGLDRAEFERWLVSDDIAAELEANCRMAVERGVFGNPSFLVGDALFWGQDRLVLVRRAIERRDRGGSDEG